MSDIVTINTSPEAILQAGRQTIAAEADALNSLASLLDDQFVKAVRYCLKAKQQQGRVMICGIGKSGHIGKKIAATMASTGNPAYFIHPTEAAHGDMGMITSRDVVMVLSKSGESSELVPMLEYCARHSIAVIAVTADETSFLAKQASVVLQLPQIGESPISDTNAPTNSTVMTLAVGDALAMALLHDQGFSREDFAYLHPGGALGAQLTSVAQVMHQGQAMPLIDAQAKFAQALVEISAKRMGCVGIVDQQGALCGMLTDGDVRRHLTKTGNIDDVLAVDIASRSPKTIASQALCATAISEMERLKITALFVVDDSCLDQRPIGVVHLHDLLKLKVV